MHQSTGHSLPQRVGGLSMHHCHQGDVLSSTPGFSTSRGSNPVWKPDSSPRWGISRALLPTSVPCCPLRCHYKGVLGGHPPSLLLLFLLLHSVKGPTARSSVLCLLSRFCRISPLVVTSAATPLEPSWWPLTSLAAKCLPPLASCPWVVPPFASLARGQTRGLRRLGFSAWAPPSAGGCVVRGF